MRRKSTDDLALTDEEIQVLGSSRTPESVKAFVSRQQQQVGIRTSAYQKIAAAARAERLALTEIALLTAARMSLGEPSDQASPEQVAIGDDRTQLLATVEDQRRKIAALSSAGAEVVYGD